MLKITFFLIAMFLANSLSFAHSAHHSNKADLSITKNRPPLPFSSELGGEFTLTDHSGNQVSNKDFRGQYVLLYFGYTDCADICPAGLHAAGRALDVMGEDASQVVPLFVNIDHELASLKDLESYVHLFHPRFVGLTGSKQAIRQAASLYEVRYSYVDKGEVKSFLVHSGKVFFHGKDGKVKAYFPHEVTAEWLAAEMTRLILKDKNADR